MQQAAGCSSHRATVAVHKVQPNFGCVWFACFSWNQHEHSKKEEVKTSIEIALQINVIHILQLQNSVLNV